MLSRLPERKVHLYKLQIFLFSFFCPAQTREKARAVRFDVPIAEGSTTAAVSPVNSVAGGELLSLSFLDFSSFLFSLFSLCLNELSHAASLVPALTRKGRSEERQSERDN